MLTFLHPLVDFCSVAVLATGGITFERWLAYNALAFALQLPLGVALDVRPRWLKGMFAAGVALTVAGVALGVVFAGECGGRGVTALSGAFGLAGRVILPWVALAAACVGNALFHLTAGAFVLEKSPGRSGPIGLFISTGALGLMAGQQAVKGGCAWAVLPVAAALLAGGVWWLWRGRDLPSRLSSPVSCPHPSPGLVFGLFALVVWRSWAGLLAGGMSSGAGLAFVLAGAAVTWAGKAAGGYAADALQRTFISNPVNPVNPVFKTISPRSLVTAISVAGSAVLCFACTPSNAITWLVLLFIAQLATGPVLSLMYDATERRAGTAFGLNCLGLFTGSLF